MYSNRFAVGLEDSMPVHTTVQGDYLLGSLDRFLDIARCDSSSGLFHIYLETQVV